MVAVADALRRRHDQLHQHASLDWVDVPVEQRLYWTELAYAGLAAWLSQLHDLRERRQPGDG